MKNIGHIERIIRTVLGLVLIGFAVLVRYTVITAVTLSTFWAGVLIVVGAILLANAIFGWSLYYYLLNINSYEAEESFCPIPHVKPSR